MSQMGTDGIWLVVPRRVEKFSRRAPPICTWSQVLNVGPSGDLLNEKTTLSPLRYLESVDGDYDDKQTDAPSDHGIHSVQITGLEEHITGASKANEGS